MIAARYLLLLLALLAAPPSSAAETTDSVTLIETQRQLFIEVYPRAELGDFRPAAKHEQTLESYVLWPDLRAAWLRSRIRNHDYTEVDSFLEQYGTLKPARELRYRYALALGRRGHFAEYAVVYQQFYQGLDVARLDCLGLQADIEAGRESQIVNRGVSLWLTGNNQVEECDLVFDNLRHANVLGNDLYAQRFELAVNAREFAIARYLARSLPAGYGETANQWTAVVNNAEGFVSGHDTSRNSDTYKEQLVYAVERLAYKQPALAHEKWKDISVQYDFSDAQRFAIERHIALWVARRHVPDASAMLDRLPDEAKDSEVGRWLARSSLLASDWPGAILAIEAMPDSDQQAQEWQYWLGYAQLRSTDDARATQILKSLAAERSYYGFLAADLLGRDYSFSHQAITIDEAVIVELANRPDIIRARELFLVGLESRGRSEWDAAVAMLGEHGKLQASVLAHRWGWHSRAIATVADAGQFDDLEIRYPLVYRQAFESYSSAVNVRHSWAYGIARSESLFMRDVRSSAGAIGIMQLMPETGRRTAGKIRQPYSGHATLTDPDSNIRLGTAYLAMMLERFDDNHVLATAAYNAGPINVTQWLPESGDIDPRIWIENIPYNETRKYVRRVLATDIIADWRMSGTFQRLTPMLPTVSAPAPTEQMAEID